MATHLTSAEAAARLGVKRETLYAYVSRGLLDRTLSLDGRSSLFDADQVDELRQRRRRSAKGELRTVVTTAITELDESGHRYRGVPVHELLDTTFESVADLLWQHEGSWDVPLHLVASVRKALSALPPDTPVLDRYRVAVAVTSALDPMRHRPTPAAHAQAGRTMIGAVARALGPPHSEIGSVAGQLVAALSGADCGSNPDDRRRVVDLALILLADHGLAASTYGARIAASVRADPYSIVAAGLGPVGGLLHGAASLGVHQLFVEAERRGVAAAVGARLASGERLPGVGHTIYREVDPREKLLSAAILDGWNRDPRLDTFTGMRDHLTFHLDSVINVDFALGALTWMLDGPEWSGEAIFALARMAGWIAHGIEEFEEAPVRFRPAARYVPPPAAEILEVPGEHDGTGRPSG